MKTKSYSELLTIPTFLERYRYLRLPRLVGEETFGYDRYLNQAFYTSREWRAFRHEIIARDQGFDLAVEDRDIGGIITIHHIIPITPDAIVNGSPLLFDPDNVVCVSDITHKAIHYGDESLLISTEPTIRTRFDTCPWKKN